MAGEIEGALSGKISRVDFGGRTLIDLTGDTVDKEVLLEGYTAHKADGTQLAGTIPDNGKIEATMDGIHTTSVTIPEGYTTGGTVSLTGDIDAALLEIFKAIEEKGVEVPEGTKIDGMAELIRQITVEVVVVSEKEPENTDKMWMDTGSGGILKYYDGTQWTPAVSVWS